MSHLLTRLSVIALSAIFFAVVTVAQENSIELTADDLDARIIALDSDTTLSAEELTEARDTLTRALRLVRQAAVRQSLVDQFVNEADNIATISSELAAELVAAQLAPDLPPDLANIDIIGNQLEVFESELNSLETSRNELRNEQSILADRSAQIADEIAAANRQLDELQLNSAGSGSGAVNALEDARRAYASVRQNEQRQLVNDLQRELGTIPARQSIVSDRLNVTQAGIETLNTVIGRLNSLLSETNRGRAELARSTAEADIERFADSASALAAIAQENLNLARQLEQIIAGNPPLELETRNLRLQFESLQQSNETVNQILATGSLTDELGELMLSVRSSLPRETTLRQRISNNEEARVSFELNQILWRNRLQRLAIPSESAARLLASGANALSATEISPEMLGNAIELLEKRRVTLQELIDAAQAGSGRLAELAVALNDTLNQSEELTTVLDRRLLWLRNSASHPRTWITNLPTGLIWLLNPASWENATATLVAQSLDNILITLLALLLPLVIIRQKSALKQRMQTLSDLVGKVGRDTYFVTPEALLICLILALPVPIIVGGISVLLAFQDDPEPFVQALVPSLGSLSLLLFVLILFRYMARPNGVFELHFNWSSIASKNLRKHLSWFMWVGGLTAFVYLMGISSGDPVLRYGLSMFAFVAGSIAMAVLSFQFFKPTGGVIADIVLETPAIPILVFLFPFLVLTPLLLAVIPFFGYFDAAIRLQSNVFSSGLILFAAAIVYGLSLRLFMVGQRRLALRHVREKRAKLEAERASSGDVEASGEVIPVSTADTELQPEAISHQIRNLLYSIAVVVFAAGLWATWRPLLPALGIADDLILWETVSSIDGMEFRTPVTLWNITLSVVLLFGGFIAARNIRGILEVGVFSRTKLDAGARYATVTIAGYILIAIGLIGSFSQLGIDWSRLQWIIAALGVGLGFGLQEIVANFVSGLIILFERPVRVGDVVTIGNLSGTVSNIRIRAATITDFDNHEVLLPNKTIITENVTNWTLTDSVTRVVLRIGVAYGSNLELTKEILMDVVKSQPDVLESPPPTIFFLNHGESSLDFEVRVFVSPPTKRLPVTHELNLAMNRALNANNIEIPFPQRDIHVIAADKNLPLEENNGKK